MKKLAMLTFVVALASVASAADVRVTEDITESTLWTNDNTYYLDARIYVNPGASLTIQPGTLVVGNAETADSVLVVTRGAQLFAMGTQNKPIIFTSQTDVDAGMDSWRATSGEWGNITIMGNALIAANKDALGSGAFDGLDEAQMEGLAEENDTSDARTLYGGNDDDDDSGVIQYVSLRYGGKVLNANDELNGMSLGGIGRGTEMSHIEIMNNIDDGIEIWGGTVNLKYVSIWNIGDDSFDLDQGFRGKAQFGLIVQGFCGTKKQGSGIGDNCFEMDGAEKANHQPFGSPLIYNFTAIGQNVADAAKTGDNGTDFRDNMRAQFRNCVFMDIGGLAVSEERLGYGEDGVPELIDLFSTPVSELPSNDTGMDANAVYATLTEGNWCQFSSCVFYNMNETDTLDGYGILDAQFENVLATEMPIVSIERGDVVLPDGEVSMAPVVKLNPLAANDAVSSNESAPDDGFFTPASYKGAFDGHNWLKGWTAADAYGMIQ